MLKLGIILTAATVTVLIAEFFRTRRRPLPARPTAAELLLF
jgi:hypothetical protein